MNLVVHEGVCSTGKHHIDFTVTQSGMELVVHAANAVLEGEAFELTADAHLTIQGDPDHDVAVNVWMVDHLADHVFGLLVDEWVLDGIDAMYEDFATDGYRNLGSLLIFRVPAGAATLDAVTVELYKLVPGPHPNAVVAGGA
jgi:hypothetical protein